MTATPSNSATDLALESRFSKADVIETDLENELILMRPQDGEMFGLNGTGRFIWQILPEASLGEVAERVAARFGISEAEALSDCRELVASLLAQGLLTEA